jgi:hypothetical protein
MHGSSFPLAVPCLLAVDLGKHLSQVAPLCHTVAMGAVSSGDVVIIPQSCADTSGNGFLPDVEMNEPWNMALGKESLHIRLKPPDSDHSSIHIHLFPLVSFDGHVLTSSLERVPSCEIDCEKRKGFPEVLLEVQPGLIDSWLTGTSATPALAGTSPLG